MANDQNLDLHLDLATDDSYGLTSSGAAFQVNNVTCDDRFPDVDDILDRLTMNTKAVEKK
jgi:hypothetical protein